MTDNQDWWATPPQPPADPSAAEQQWAPPAAAAQPAKDPQPLGWGLVLAAVGVLVGTFVPWASIGFRLPDDEGLGGVFGGFADLSADVSGTDLNGGIVCIICALALGAVGLVVATGQRFAQARLSAIVLSAGAALSALLEVLYLRSKDPTGGFGRLVSDDFGVKYDIGIGPWVVMAAAAVGLVVAVLLKPSAP